VLRPGFSRVSFPYFVSAREVEYVLRAIADVASHAWRLLPCYRFNAKTGEWCHRTRLTRWKERKWLGRGINFVAAAAKDDAAADDGAPVYGTSPLAKDGTAPCDPDPAVGEWAGYLAEGRALMAGGAAAAGSNAGSGDALGADGADHAALLPDDVARLRWCVFPSDVAAELAAAPAPAFADALPAVQPAGGGNDGNDGNAVGPVEPAAYGTFLADGTAEVVAREVSPAADGDTAAASVAAPAAAPAAAPPAPPAAPAPPAKCATESCMRCLITSIGVMIKSCATVATAPVAAAAMGVCAPALTPSLILALSYTEKYAACAGMQPKKTALAPRHMR